MHRYSEVTFMIYCPSKELSAEQNQTDSSVYHDNRRPSSTFIVLGDYECNSSQKGEALAKQKQNHFKGISCNSTTWELQILCQYALKNKNEILPLNVDQWVAYQALKVLSNAKTCDKKRRMKSLF